MPPVKMRGDGRKAKNPKKTLLRLLSYMKPYLPTLGVVLLCIIANAVAQTAGSRSLGTLVDSYILPMVQDGSTDFAPSEPAGNTPGFSGKTCAGWVWTTTGRRRPKARGVPFTIRILINLPKWGCCTPATAPAVSCTASMPLTSATALMSTPAPAGT